MCGLCGVLGTTHWSDAPTGPGASEAAARPRRERLARVRLLNRVLAAYALQVDDFHGRSYVLANRTGRTEVVPDVMAVWSVGAAMLGRPLDPLDETLLQRLEASTTVGEGSP